jgi:uncharacterized membrane protein
MASPKKPQKPQKPQKPGGGGKREGPNYSTSTSTEVEPNVAGALAYTLGPITGIVFLVMEKSNRFVRFHAAQSTVVGVIVMILAAALSGVSGVLAHVPWVGWLLVFLLTFGPMVAGFVVWAALIWKAYQGEEEELPIVGPIARRIVRLT